MERGNARFVANLKAVGLVVVHECIERHIRIRVSPRTLADECMRVKSLMPGWSVDGKQTSDGRAYIDVVQRDDVLPLVAGMYETGRLPDGWPTNRMLPAAGESHA